MALSWPSTPIVLPSAAIGLILSLPLALACAPDVVPPSVEPPERAIYSPPLPEAYCYVAFSPDEAARPAFEVASARWTVATGCEIRAGEGGVPVLAAPLLFVEYDRDGNPSVFADNPSRARKQLCGISIWDVSLAHVERIHIALDDPRCTAEDAAVHETGHALSGLRQHAVDGVMAPGGDPRWSPLITEQSLALACAGTACRVFEPE